MVPFQHARALEQDQSEEDHAHSIPTSSLPFTSQNTATSVAEVVERPLPPRVSAPDHKEKSRMGLGKQTSEGDPAADDGQRPSSITPILSGETRRPLGGPRRNLGSYRLSPLGNGSESISVSSPFPPDDSLRISSDGAQSRVVPVVVPPNPRTRGRGFSLRRSLLARSVHEQGLGSGSILELQRTASSTMKNKPLASTDIEQSNHKSGASATISPVRSGMSGDRDRTSSKETRTLLSLPHYESWVRSRTARPQLLVRLQRWGETIRKTILRIHEIPSSKDGRHLDLDVSRQEALIDERTGREYVDNIIRSCRYTLWNFLPRQLFAQFSKLANFYFLCVSILQMIPGLSTTGNFTTIVPLTFFVILSMAKEGYDDLRRYKLDKVENNQSASVLRIVKSTDAPVDGNDKTRGVDHGPKIWATTKWKEIKVGDVVKLNRNEAAPADLVLLHSKGANGIAYLETMALDGETNLKSKQALPCLARNCHSIDAIADCKAQMVVEDPNLDFYSFEGKCSVADETLPLTNNEIVYRGSILRNTPELYGMVIYSGEECKIRMNATKNPRIKAPALQAVVNRIVIIIVLFVLALAIFNTVAYQIWVATTEKKAWYLVNAKVAFFPILSSFIIMFNTMIPLSLYVSLEIVKLCQLYFMNDLAMYDEASDTPMEARTSTINEELGQVKYGIFPGR